MVTSKPLTIAQLEERGWSMNIRRIHLGDGPRDLESIQKLERRRAWKQDVALERDGIPALTDRKGLGERGWTPAMVAQFLGAPHYEAKLGYSGFRVVHLFRVRDAIAVEATDEWRERAAEASKRSAAGRAAAEKRAEELRDRVEDMSFRLVVNPPKSLTVLRKSALRDKARWELDHGNDDFDPDTAPPEVIDRWCRNYLRHHCSNYESLLSRVEREFRGMPGVRDVYADIIRPRIDTLVDDAMTMLVAAEQGVAV